MRKGLIVLLAAVLVAAFTLPAMADQSATGFIRTKAWMSNFMSNTAGTFVPVQDARTNSFVETRARILYKAGTEDAQFVYYGEFDQEWGGQAYFTGRNTGGGLEADTTNLETKNIYVMFKIPNTSWDFKVGVQNQTDSYAGVIFGVADMAGVFATFKYDPVSFRLGWAKFWENANTAADDVDLYLIEAKFAPMPDVKLGLNFYFLNDMGAGVKGTPGSGGASSATVVVAESSGYDNLRLYIPGFDFSAKAGPATVSGWFFYQTGTFEVPGGTDVDVSGFAGNLRADMNLGPGKFFVEGLYVSGDDNSGDTDYKGIITASHYNLAGSFYYRPDLQFLGANGDDINTSQSLVYEMSNGGAGIWMLAAGYSQKLTDKLSGKVGIGYAAANEKRVRDGVSVAANFANDSAMALEVNANVNYNISKGLDIGLYGAYAFLGSAYDVTSGSDRDDPYMLFARLNFGF
jgi:hypothetical protein